MTITITLPGQPKGKGRPRFRVVKSKTGKVFGSAFTDAQTRSYETLLREAAEAVMGEAPLLEGALQIDVEARFDVPQSWSRKKREAALRGEVMPTGRPDLDNLVKVLDALNSVVWRDDSQIVIANIAKLYADRPALVIKVSPASMIR